MALVKKVKWLFTFVVLANLVIVLVVILGALQPAPPRPMPNPNGYDDFVKAGTMLSGKAGDFYTMSEHDLAALVSTNAEALKLTRVGLARECRAPDEYSHDYIDRTLPELLTMKALAQNLCAEGRLAIIEHHTNDAIKSYLDAVRFGDKSGQGTLLFAKMVSVACESIGRQGLLFASNTADSGQCRKIVQEFEITDAGEFSIKDTLEQERRWARKAGSLRDKIESLVHYNSERKAKEDWLKDVTTNQIKRRQVMIAFATRAYELEKGKSPATISDLVPDYLKAIPKNPITGSNLVLSAISP
jgi:hypothetical protein